MRNISIIDSTFDISITSSYHLAVIAQPKSISFAVLDTVHMKFLAFKNTIFKDALESQDIYNKIENAIKTESYLNKNYKKLSFCFADPKATLVPAGIFDQNATETLGTFLELKNDNSRILSRYIKDLNAYLVYAIPEQIYSVAQTNLDDPTFYHQSIPFISNALQLKKGKAAINKVYLNMYDTFVDVLVVEQGKIQLYNSFPYKTVTDVLFYVLYLYDHLGLSIDRSGLELSGKIEDNGDLVNQFKSYIPSVELMEFNRSFTYSTKFNDLPQHQFANLINIFRCE